MPMFIAFSCLLCPHVHLFHLCLPYPHVHFIPMLSYVHLSSWLFYLHAYPIFMFSLSPCLSHLHVYPVLIFIVSQYLSHPHIYFIPSLCLSHPYIHPSFIFIPSAPLLHPDIHVHLISSALLSHSHSSPSYDHLSPISIPSHPHSISFPCSS